MTLAQNDAPAHKKFVEKKKKKKKKDQPFRRYWPEDKCNGQTNISTRWFQHASPPKKKNNQKKTQLCFWLKQRKKKKKKELNNNAANQPTSLHILRTLRAVPRRHLSQKSPWHLQWARADRRAPTTGNIWQGSRRAVPQAQPRPGRGEDVGSVRSIGRCW